MNRPSAPLLSSLVPLSPPWDLRWSQGMVGEKKNEESCHRKCRSNRPTSMENVNARFQRSKMVVFACSVLIGACDEQADDGSQGLENYSELPSDGPTTGAVEPAPPADEDGAELEPLADLSDSELEPYDPGRLPPLDIAAPIDPKLVSAQGYWSWGTSGNNGVRYYLGSAANRTCFLQGVTGELQSAPGLTSAGAYVRIDQSLNQWYIETDAGVAESWGDGGSGVMAHVSCIGSTANREFIHWPGNSSSGSNTLYANAPRNANTRCFLSAVWGTVGWSSPNSWAGLRKATGVNGGDIWQLEGNLLKEQDGSSGGGAEAYCVDISNQIVSPYSWSAPVVVGGELLTSSTYATTCAVQRLGGNLASNPYGWWDGVRVYPRSSSGGDQWWLEGFASKHIGGECYRTPTFFPGF